MSSVAKDAGRHRRARQESAAAPLLTGWRRAVWVTVITALVAVLGLSGVLPQTLTSAQAAPPVANAWGADAVNCSYGTSGAPGSSASTVCWLNVSTWGLTPGTTTTGRTAQIGAYRFTYDVRVTQNVDGGNPLNLARVFNATWAGAGFGNSAYANTSHCAQ